MRERPSPTRDGDGGSRHNLRGPTGNELVELHETVEADPPERRRQPRAGIGFDFDHRGRRHEADDFTVTPPAPDLKFLSFVHAAASPSTPADLETSSAPQAGNRSPRAGTIPGRTGAQCTRPAYSHKSDSGTARWADRTAPSGLRDTSFRASPPGRPLCWSSGQIHLLIRCDYRLTQNLDELPEAVEVLFLFQIYLRPVSL